MAAAARRRRDRDLRVRRARHPQRRLGLRQQPDRHARGDHPHRQPRDGSGEGQRDREEGRRAPRAGAGLRHVLGRRRSRRTRSTSRSTRRSPYSPRSRRRCRRTRTCGSRRRRPDFKHEWKFLATSEGSFIEQNIYYTTCQCSATARIGGTDRRRAPTAATARRAARSTCIKANMPGNAERVAAEAVEHAMAKPVGAGVKDLVLLPSHLQLTIHEIIAHPDRARSRRRLRSQLRGHELRHAEGSRQAEIRLEAVQHLRRSHASGRHVDGRLRR